MGRLGAAIGLGLLALSASAAFGAETLVVSTWGGNWKEGTEIIGKEFTKRTGIGVTYVTGGTLDRLAKARVAKDNPEVDITYTTSHVGFLYQASGLFEKLDWSKIPNFKDLHAAGNRGDYEVGVYSYVYSPVFRPDLMPKGFSIPSWNTLWSPEVKGKLAMPDFDPSHIIIASSKLAGADAKNWKAGIPLLEKLKPSIKAFYTSDANSQDLFQTGETPVQIMLSINAYHLMSLGIPATISIPKEGAIVGIGALGISKNTKKLAAAHEFINVALDPKVQEQICEFHKCSPMNKNAHVSPELAKLPGILLTEEQWKTDAIVTDDETQAKLLPEWKSWFTENMTR